MVKISCTFVRDASVQAYGITVTSRAVLGKSVNIKAILKYIGQILTYVTGTPVTSLHP